MKKFEQYYKLIVLFVFCVAVIAVYKTFDSVSAILGVIKAILGALTPFAIGFVIAYLLNLPSKKLTALLEKSKRKFVREKAYGLGIFITYIAALLAVLVIIGALVPALSRNILDLYNNFPTYVTSVTNYLQNIDIVKKLNLLGDGNSKLYEAVNKIFARFDITEFGKYAQGVFSFTSGIIDAFIAIVASIYMLLDKKNIVGVLKRVSKLFLSESKTEWLMVHCKRINEIFAGYIYSRFICSVVMAVVCGVVLSILRVKYAIILGIFIGAMDMIPYFGSIISCVISCVVVLITGGPWKLLWAGIALLILQQLDGNLLGPKIMGNTLEIRPLWIVFAVTVGGSLFGFLGMLLSVPVLAIIRAIAVDYLDEIEEKKAARTEVEKEENKA